jgi:hypothetical protein
VPQGLFEALVHPFRLASGVNRVAESAFRDGRYAILILLGIAVLLGLAWSRRRTHPSPQAAATAGGRFDQRAVERFLLVFFPIGYVLWQTSFGIVRYAAPLEAIAPIVMILLVRRLVARPSSRVVLAAACSVVMCATMHPLSQERIPWSERLIEVQAPRFEAPDRILVVVAHNAPWAFVLPFLQPEIRVLGLISNLTKPTDSTRFQVEMREIIARHEGEIYLLTDDGYVAGDFAALSENFGLQSTRAACARVMTRLQGIPIYLCPVRKAP